MQLPCLHQLVYGRGVQPAAHGRAVASGGASGARPPIWNRCSRISHLTPRLLHTSNTVF